MKVVDLGARESSKLVQDNKSRDKEAHSLICWPGESSSDPRLSVARECGEEKPHDRQPLNPSA